MHKKATPILLVLFSLPTTACDFSIDGAFEFLAVIDSPEVEFYEEGLADPCTDAEVRDNADRLESAEIVSMVMLVTDVPEFNVASSASATLTLGSSTRTIDHVQISVDGTPISFELSLEERDALSAQILNCEPIEWTVSGTADDSPVAFSATVTVEMNFEASTL